MAQHQQFTVELKRLTQELGTEGVLGGQIELSGAEGDWRQLVEHINTMSANLTTQIRAIADVVEAAANGDYSRQLVVAASGETARLRDAVNRLNARLVAGDNTPQRATRNGVIDADMPKLSGANEVETTIEVFDEIEPGND
jgi:methyl-accepting chemotaxis protein